MAIVRVRLLQMARFLVIYHAMKLQPLARSLLLVVPLLDSLACSSSNPPQVDLKNNTNAPMVPTNASGTLGTIERLDPALDQLLPKEAKLEILVQGLDWAEGPVWDARHGRLIFSDVPQNTAYQWSPGKGVSVYLKPSGYTGTTPRGGEPGSNGLTMDREGRLVLSEHGDHRLARLEKDGKKTTLADLRSIER